MTKEETAEFAIAYSEKMAQESDEQAMGLEELAPRLHDAHRANFMKAEAKVLREQASRFREMAKTWADAAA
jgi:hypothetical protein